MTCVPFQAGVQQDRPAYDEIWVFVAASHRVRPQHVNIALQPADEIRPLGRFESLFHKLIRRFIELFHAGAGPTREDKYRPPNWVADLAFLEAAILHGRQEVPKPAQLHSGQGCIELIPEHQRELTAQADIPYLVKRRQQFFR